MNPPIRVLRTAQLYQADMATAALKDAGVPHQLRQESSNDMDTPMGLDPGIAFGTVWSVLVPGRYSTVLIACAACAGSRAIPRA